MDLATSMVHLGKDVVFFSVLFPNSRPCAPAAWLPQDAHSLGVWEIWAGILLGRWGTWSKEGWGLSTGFGGYCTGWCLSLEELRCGQSNTPVSPDLTEEKRQTLWECSVGELAGLAGSWEIPHCDVCWTPGKTHLPPLLLVN